MMILSLLLKFFVFQSSFGFSPSPTIQIDDRTPGVMVFLPLPKQVDFFVQPYIEGSRIREEIFSFTKQSSVTRQEQSSISLNLGFDFFSHHLGIQFWNSDALLFPYTANLNYQFDLIKNDNFLMALSGLFGDGSYPDERHGLQLLAAFELNGVHLYSSLQYGKSKRRYFSASSYTSAGTTDIVPDNGLSYDLQSVTTSVGVRYANYKKLGAALEISMGWQNNLVLSQYDVRFQPVNYLRSDGIVFSGSLILPLGSSNLLSSFRGSEQ